MSKKHSKREILTGTILSTGEKEYFKLENIPDFICTHGYNSNLEISTLEGETIASTFGVFLNRIVPEVRELIIEDLQDMQLGGTEPSKSYTLTLEEVDELIKY